MKIIKYFFEFFSVLSLFVIFKIIGLNKSSTLGDLIGKNIAKDFKAKIITTEKDYNRLSKIDSKGIEYLKIELKISNEEELINFLKDKI